MYINILLMEAVPCEDNSKKTKIDIILPDETLTIYANLLQGGQRILIPGEIADLLIKTLLDDQTFTIQIGPKKLIVITDNFEASYTKLLEIEIEEEDVKNSEFESSLPSL